MMWLCPFFVGLKKHLKTIILICITYKCVMVVMNHSSINTFTLHSLTVIIYLILIQSVDDFGLRLFDATVPY